MIIELHSLISHDFFTISTHKHNPRDYDCRKLSNASRIRLWTLINDAVMIGTASWVIHKK